jgi:hypothetical protein
MAITALKRIENRSNFTAKVRDLENANVKGHDVPVEPGRDLEVDMWIPWAAKQGDFGGHHLEVDYDGAARFCIWQANNADGDFVRFSTDSDWHDQGAHVNGVPEVDGDRTMVLFDDRFEFTTYSGQAHGVTAIIKLRNRATAPVSLLDMENTNTSGHGVPVNPGDDLDVDMWVPWASNVNDFNGHHLRIDIGGTPRFWIWQSARSDGDWLRYSTDAGWHDPGDRVPGVSDVRGDRAITVKDDTIDVVTVQRRLPPPADAGVDYVTPYRPDINTFTYTRAAMHAFC